MFLRPHSRLPFSITPHLTKKYISFSALRLRNPPPPLASTSINSVWATYTSCKARVLWSRRPPNARGRLVAGSALRDMKIKSARARVPRRGRQARIIYRDPRASCNRVYFGISIPKGRRLISMPLLVFVFFLPENTLTEFFLHPFS